MTSFNWETIEAPTNTNSPFYKWGDKEGQTLVGVVTAFTADGGTDFDGHSCPRIDLELTEKSHTLQGTEWVELEVGTSATWQGNSPARLAQRLRAANPQPGDLIKMKHEGQFKTPKGTGKDITVKIARGAGTIIQPPKPATSAEPPF